MKNIKYLGLSQINGPLVIIDNVNDVSYEELVILEDDNHNTLHGRIIEIDGNRAVIQVFEGTSGLSTKNTSSTMIGKPLTLPLSKELLGRIFSGSGKPIDGLGPILSKEERDINGLALNPVARKYPRDYINTGVSAIDGLNTLIRGQKLPIFSGSGLPHDQLAVQIVKHANIAANDGCDFGIVFAAMGIKHDVAQYFKKSFEETGVLEKVVMFLNVANDPIIERILTPRCALTAAEYLAYECNMHILVIMTDMTSYCEALREFSASKGEIPGRKGYPGYLYSDLASLFERAGIIENKLGSVTQIPILTMPNDDITHPIPDLTGYITEGQIVLDRTLAQNNIMPPIGILPSLSRLMKDGIGAGYTREDHSIVSNQLFASYSKVLDARSLASVIGEDELSYVDKLHISFGKLFEKVFLNQGFESNRSIIDTLELGWNLLSLFPKSQLDRIEDKYIDKYYDHQRAIKYFETGEYENELLIFRNE